MYKIIQLVVLISTMLAFSNLAYAGDTTNLEGAWLLNETSGARADESVNTNNLTDNNTVLFGTGQFGNAADFELSNSEYLSITDGSQSGLDVTGDITFGLWYKPETVGIQASLIGKSGTSKGYNLQARTDNTVLCLSSSDGSAFDGQFFSTTTLTISTWYHIVCRISSTTMTIWIDGTQETGSDTTNGSINNSTAVFMLGANDAPTNFTDGLVDDAFIFSEALSEAQIDDIKDNGLDAYVTVPRSRVVMIT